MSAYRLIEAKRTSFSVGLMCRMLGVSRSGYYDWRKRAPSSRSRRDGDLTGKIVEIHQRSRGTYGSPRVHAELRSVGVRCSRKRVERLMREAGVRGCMRGGRKGTTRSSRWVKTAEDLVNRDFAAARADKVWVADITYVPTEEGFLYLAFILDVHSRRIVGWAMENHLRTELVVNALTMAVWRRRPAPGLVHHSDQGVQGGFNWSSQHRPREVLLWDDHRAGPHDSQDARPYVLRGLRGSAISASASESSGRPSLRGSAARTPERGSACRVQSQRVGSAILAE